MEKFTISENYSDSGLSTYTFNTPENVSKPGDIIVYSATTLLNLRHLVLGKEEDFGISQIDVSTRDGRRFLLLEKGQQFSEAICHNVFSKASFMELFMEPDYNKEHNKVDLNDRMIIETADGFKYASADGWSGIVGTKINGTGYYNDSKVKVLGAITPKEFYKRATK